MRGRAGPWRDGRISGGFWSRGGARPLFWKQRGGGRGEGQVLTAHLNYGHFRDNCKLRNRRATLDAIDIARSAKAGLIVNPPPVMSLPQISGYQLKSRLGQGAFGTVYQATWARLNARWEASK